jgi:hypothetical protein
MYATKIASLTALAVGSIAAPTNVKRATIPSFVLQYGQCSQMAYAQRIV